jgi:lysophospholipase
LIAKEMPDGWPIRHFNWPADGQAKGSILFLGGRGDVFEKYLETFGYWHERGWSIFSVDWRGQGGSGRFIEDPHVGHCEDFGIWIDDLAAIAAEWTARAPGPHIMMGHSMGGHLLLRALAEGRVSPAGAVLIAPMLGFDTGMLSLNWANRFVGWLTQIGWNERPAWKSNERPAPPWSPRQKMLTHDSARYSDEIWWKTTKPELELGPPSWGWLQEAYGSVLALQKDGVIEAIKTPTLSIGTEGDRLVSPAAVKQFSQRLPNGRLKMFGKSAAHEILREKDKVRDVALAEIDAFMAQLLPHT